MRRTWIRNGCSTALLAAVLLLSACNMGGRPQPQGTQEAAVVAVAPAPTEAATPPIATVPGSIEYFATPDDTLESVAERFGVQTQTLIEANALQPPFELTPGERLWIPPRQEHVVAAGDTVYNIAKRYGVPREELVRLNDIPSSNKIRIGQRLVLPPPPVVATAEAPQAAVTAADATAPAGPPISLQTPAAAATGPSQQDVTTEELPPPAEKPTEPAAEAPAPKPMTLAVPQPRPAKPAEPKVTAAPAPAPQPAPAPATTQVTAVEPAAPTPQPPAAAPAAVESAAPAPAPAATEPPPAETATAEPEVPATPPAASAESGVETLTAAVPEPPPLAGDKFLWPVADGKVVLGFGPGAGGQQNDGVNIAAAEGAAVRAAENGVVAYAGNELRGFGNLLLIRHADGWMSAYAHNETLLVKRGDTVKRGQIVARVGKTGNVTEPQLHFELRRGTRALDPVPYLGEGGSDVTPGASPGAQPDPG